MTAKKQETRVVTIGEAITILKTRQHEIAAMAEQWDYSNCLINKGKNKNKKF